MIFGIVFVLAGGGTVVLTFVGGVVGYIIKKKKTGSKADETQPLLDSEGHQTPEQLDTASDALTNDAKDMLTTSDTITEKEVKCEDKVSKKGEQAVSNITTNSNAFSEKADTFNQKTSEANSELTEHLSQIAALNQILNDAQQNHIATEMLLREKEQQLIATLEKLAESSQLLSQMQDNYEKQLERLQCQPIPEQALLQMKDEERALKTQEIASLKAKNKELTESNAALINVIGQYRQQLEEADAKEAHQNDIISNLLLQIETLKQSNNVGNEEPPPGDNPMNPRPNLRFF